MGIIPEKTIEKKKEEKEENSLNRGKIGGETAKILKEAESWEDVQRYLARLHNIEL